MSTLIKIIVTSILSLSFLSCNLNFGVKGNGKVISENRSINKSFNTVEVSRGLDVYLTQNDSEKIIVEADENLHEFIITKVENNVLKIYTEKNIWNSSEKKVLVSFKNISKISASSGSDVYVTNALTTEHLQLKTSSGADLKLDVKVNKLYCSASSGSDIRVTGISDTIVIKATSGSSIDAAKLITLSAQATTTSGADIIVNVSNELIANTSSGGDITYVGNPKKVSKTGDVSGIIDQ